MFTESSWLVGFRLLEYPIFHPVFLFKYYVFVLSFVILHERIHFSLKWIYRIANHRLQFQFLRLILRREKIRNQKWKWKFLSGRFLFWLVLFERERIKKKNKKKKLYGQLGDSLELHRIEGSDSIIRNVWRAYLGREMVETAKRLFARSCSSDSDQLRCVTQLFLHACSVLLFLVASERKGKEKKRKQKKPITFCSEANNNIILRRSGIMISFALFQTFLTKCSFIRKISHDAYTSSISRSHLLLLINRFD